jgi:16S rRNA (cytosine967-C5)-methyltransferase
VTSARRVALAALKTWRTKKVFADAVITRLLSKSELTEKDRAFVLELFYGVLRNLTLLDFWIEELRSTRLHADLRDILRLGAYQLLMLKTPAHAAVFETVALAQPKHRSLINGVLRTALRNADQLQRTAAEQPLFARFSHPEFLVERWHHNFGQKATAELCEWNNRPAPLYARINRLKISPADFLHAHPGTNLLPQCKNFVVLRKLRPELIGSGHCYIQDPSTAAACDLVDPKPGDKILDACAAPGGKTAYLAEKMENRGTIIACDRDGERLELLRENLARLGVAIAKPVQHDWETAQLADEISQSAPFDRILIDAPCSNTGVMRRRVDVRWRIRPEDFRALKERQIAMVEATAKLLKPGGTLVYSTCSIEPEEDEQVAQAIWKRLSMLRAEQEERLLPFRDHFDGAFAARFLRTR